VVNLASLQLTVIKWLIIILVFLLALVASNYAWWLSFLVVLLPLLTLSILGAYYNYISNTVLSQYDWLNLELGLKVIIKPRNRFTPQALIGYIIGMEWPGHSFSLKPQFPILQGQYLNRNLLIKTKVEPNKSGRLTYHTFLGINAVYYGVSFTLTPKNYNLLRSLAKVATQTHHDYYRYFDATGATDFVRLIMNDEPIQQLLIETAYPMRATITLSHEQLQYQYEGVLNSLEKTHQIKKIIILLLMMVKKMDALRQ
jgi:hypothetical protein